MRIAYYGGSFDPLHNSHLEIIRHLQETFDLVLIQATSNWTKSEAWFPISVRTKALTKLNKKSNVQVLDWSLTEDTSSTLKVVEKITKVYGFRPEIVIGADNTKQLPKWRNWEELNSYKFFIFNRGSEPVETPMSHYEIAKPIIKNVSSTFIRNNKNLDEVPEEIREFYDWNICNMIKK